MRSGRIGGSIAAILATLAGAGLPPTTPMAVNQQAVAARQLNLKSPVTAAGLSSALASVGDILPARLYRAFHSGPPPIWVGVEKRGNRRNRSRFNYNR